MKKLLIGTLSLLTIGFGIHIERINPDPSDLVTISEAEAGRRGGGRRGGRRARRGGRRAHRSVHVDVNRRGGRGGAFVAGAIVGAAAVAIGTRHTYLPTGCTSYDYYGRPYYHCGGVYYQPVYDGPDVVYVVVDKP
ncbi:MAG TPA: hypothetical protein ENI07_24750 [Desulfobacterales bacterium]|nr:hypothetical protein [Desulfobacterales bacterium]